MQANGTAARLPGLPERVAPFAPRGGTHKLKYVGEFAHEGSKGWIHSLLSGEARYAGSEALARPYEEAPWVHVALKAISSAVRSCPLRFYTIDPKEDPSARPIPTTHRLHELFRKPNPIMTFSRFIEAGVLHRKLDGENIWFVFNENKEPIGTTGPAGRPRFTEYPSMIMPVRGSLVGMKRDSRNFPGEWQFPTKGEPIAFTPDQIVHFADYDPSNPLRGLGDVQVLLRDLVLEFGAQRYLEAMLRNSGDPGGYILVDDDLSREEQEAAQLEAEDKFSTQNKGRWRVISGQGIKYEAAKFGPRDMEYETLMDKIAEKTAAVLGVPLPVMGKLDDATYSNYGTAVAQFWQNGNGVLAYLASEEDTINTEFMPRLPGADSRLIARYDTSHVEALQDDNAAKLDLAKNLANAQVGLSFDEAAGLVGLRGTETEFGSIAWLPPNITTAEEALEFADEQLENGRVSADVNGMSPPQTTNQEEDDFPGSNDGESGSNGPTGSDGKEAAPRQRSDDATLHRSQGQPSPYFKSYEAGVLAPGEQRVQRAMRDYLGSYQRATLKRIRDLAANGVDHGLKATRANPMSPQDIIANEALLTQLLLDYAEWVQKLAEKMNVPLSEILNAAGDGIATELGGQAINSTDPWATEFLRKQRIQLAEGVNSTLAKMVKQALVEVFEKKPFDLAPLQQHLLEALPELQGSLKKAFASRSARANTIARTEVNRAASGTRFEAMQREGVEEHQWVTSGDEQVRSRAPHSHRELDGVIRPVGESFREGRLLRYPSDPAGEPGDVINCRCVSRPILKD